MKRHRLLVVHPNDAIAQFGGSLYRLITANVHWPLSSCLIKLARTNGGRSATDDCRSEFGCSMAACHSTCSPRNCKGLPRIFVDRSRTLNRRWERPRKSAFNIEEAGAKRKTAPFVMICDRRIQQIRAHHRQPIRENFDRRPPVPLLPAIFPGKLSHLKKTAL